MNMMVAQSLSVPLVENVLARPVHSYYELGLYVCELDDGT